jgi:23S rRNA pseudouridine1911/1915/1917 synthase
MPVPEGLAGMRVDAGLARLLGLSRTVVATLAENGEVELDGAPAGKSDRLVAGAWLQVRLPEAPAPLENTPAEVEGMTILYSDDDIVAVDKPAGLVVHPGAGNPAGTLLNGLLHHDPKLAELPRAGIVHRLDKDTSGLMVVARTLPTCTALVDLLSRHEVERQYEAVVLGTMVAGGTVDEPIGRSMGDRLRQAVRDEEDGKRAVTHYRLRERFRAHSLLQCQLETGRTHQIRVHMAHIGHPLIGDPLYGGGLKLPRGASAELIGTLRGFRRQALHAERLSFIHPATGEEMSFSAERPADQRLLIEALREDLAEHGSEHY